MCHDTRALISTYEGIPNITVTLLQGITDYLSNTSIVVDYAPGCADVLCANKTDFQAAVTASKEADYVVMGMGLNITMENEALDRQQTSCGGLNVSDILSLPGCQLALVEAITEVNPHVIVVLINGGPLSIGTLLDSKKVVGIIEAFYPGAVGGTAVADVLFGAYNPSGRMPVTTYHSASELPPAVSYDMSLDPGRTYRYYKNKPLIPFGYGLSYSEVVYSDLRLSKNELHPCDTIKVSIVIENDTPGLPVDEIVLVYLIPRLYHGKSFFPTRMLVGFKRVPLLPKHKASVAVDINPYLMSLVDSDGVHYLFPGKYTVEVGDKTADFKIPGDSSTKVLTSSCTNSPQCLAC